jgi:LPS sulfotransferase NodH
LVYDWFIESRIDMANLSDHPAHGLRSPGRPYVLNRFHPDRITAKGYMMELRIFVQSIAKQSPRSKFLVIARPRSGTTLLTRLLNQVPQEQCDPELLHYAVLSPRRLIQNLAAKSQAQAYGCKWLSYQMLEVQPRTDARRTLEDLASDGFRFIHLTRDTFEQSKSLMVALQTRRYSSLDQGAAKRMDLRFDSDEFQRALTWSKAALDYETQLLDGLPTLPVSYEQDLERARDHQTTVDRICEFLGTPSGPVCADVKREDLARIRNLGELKALKTA